MKKTTFCLLLTLTCSLIAKNILAQSPGIVVRTAGGPYSTILDPNQDGFTSKTSAGFSTSDIGAAYSEIPYKIVPPAIAEPTGDNITGPTGGFTDIVSSVDGSGLYAYYDGTNLLLRLRIGNVISGAKGYSVLLDTDGKMGNSGPYADPNYIAPTNTSYGNPGFEYEVVLRTGTDVAVYNVDGTTTPVLVASYPLSTNSLISVALTTNSGNPDYFYDFAVPVTAIGSPSSFRMAATTTTSASSAFQGNRSDIYGVNDAAYPNVASAWQTVINAQPTIHLTDLASGGTGVGATATAAPTINSPITSGSSVAVTGTWTRMDVSKPSTATITLYKNGTAVGTTTVSTGGTWSITVPSIANGDVFYATAQATGESMSLQSSSITAGCSSVPAAPVLTCASTKGISGTRPAGTTILVYQLPTTTASPTSIPLTTNITYPTTTTFAYFVNGCSGGTNNVANGTYMLMTSNGGCTSTPVFDCIANGNSTVTVLAIDGTLAVTTPIYPYQTTISGTGATSGEIIRLFINGQYKSTITASGSTFSFTGLTLNSSDQLQLYIYKGVTCMTTTNTYTVSCYTQPPVITTNSSGNLLSSATSISGTSVYASATVTLYKGVSPSGVAVGSPVTTSASGGWSFTGLTLTAGDNYYTTISSGGCTSPSSSAASVLSPTTACPTITGSYTESSTSVTGTMPSAFTGTVRLYLDGVQIGSASLTASTSWTINSFTYPLYPGGVLSVTAQTTGAAESTGCPSTATIGCTSPPTPSISPTSATISTGQTVAFNVSNVSAGTWYALLDNNGVSYATSVYKTNTTSFNLTTNTFNTIGSYNLNLTANKLSGCPLSFHTASVLVSAPLPLTLVDFNASTEDRSVLLQWMTEDEQNVSHFEVERGFDGSVFAAIGQVKAVGNSRLPETYRFTDPAPGTGKFFYRLKMVDLDGSATYSKIAVVALTPALTVTSIAPNPFSDAINIELQLGQPQQLHIRLIDAAGKVMRSVLYNGQKGVNTIQIQQLSRLSDGVYILQLHTAGQEIQFKVLRAGGK
ncbi:MAG: T9SS type A sorting domain-containing protein [Chitinophagaceae bacterium]|nr:T9SS type A sorting domain-containing protein [Chitinophagaceae bacterium]